jgi:heme/copper-type cytochrome/quinol oxidase subunit 3
MKRPVLDVSALPDVVFGQRSIMSWGMFGMMLIEGTMFGIVLATYFYLRTRNSDWPPGTNPPGLLFGSINTAVMLASLIPNIWTSKIAKEGNLTKARLAVWIMMLFGTANLIIRVFEFASLNCHWDANAYGSVVWTILGLHTTHLLTDWYDTVVLLIFLYVEPPHGRAFMDVSENAEYWYFVVLTWLPIYFVLYFVPRLL